MQNYLGGYEMQNYLGGYERQNYQGGYEMQNFLGGHEMQNYQGGYEMQNYQGGYECQATGLYCRFCRVKKIAIGHGMVPGSRSYNVAGSNSTPDAFSDEVLMYTVQYRDFLMNYV